MTLQGLDDRLRHFHRPADLHGPVEDGGEHLLMHPCIEDLVVISPRLQGIVSSLQDGFPQFLREKGQRQRRYHAVHGAFDVIAEVFRPVVDDGKALILYMFRYILTKFRIDLKGNQA